MKINTAIIGERLAEKFDVKVYGPSTPERDLRPVAFIASDEETEDGYVYVGESQRMPQKAACARNALYICVGSEIPSFLTGGDYHVIQVFGLVTVIDVFNYLQSAFKRYELWSDELHRNLENEADPREMIRVSLPIFNNQFTLLDGNLCYMAETKWDKEKGGLILISHSDATRPQLSKEFTKIYRDIFSQFRSQKSPFTYKTPFYEGRFYSVYAVNIYAYTKCTCTLAMVDLVHPFHESDYALFDYLRKHIEQAVEKRRGPTEQSIMTVKGIIQACVKGREVSAGTVDHILNTDQLYKKKRTTPRQFACLAIREYKPCGRYSDEVICKRIEELIEGSTAFPHKGVLVAVFNINQNVESLNSALQIMEEQLILNGMKAGCSDIYEDITQSGGYFRQACVALELGIKYQNDLVIYPYMDFAEYTIFENFASGLPLQYAIPSGLLKLREHDKDSKTDYCETLLTYLENNCSIAETAKILFIQRSTLYKRQKIITDLLDIDLNDPQKRLWIWCCLYAIRQK
jgi:hypothetical protein